MSEFNYKDFLKNSSFLNETEEAKEKFSVDKLEKKVKAILKKEGGAVGLKPLVDAAKELGASKKDLMDVLKRMKSVKTHKDGDIIDTDGLKEDKKIIEERKDINAIIAFIKTAEVTSLKNEIINKFQDVIDSVFGENNIKSKFIKNIIDKYLQTRITSTIKDKRDSLTRVTED